MDFDGLFSVTPTFIKTNKYQKNPNDENITQSKDIVPLTKAK